MGESGGTREEAEAYANEKLLGILSPEGIVKWWDTPMPLTHNETPREILDRGFTLVIRQIVDEYFNPGFS
jgi:hypothetical protein